MTNPFAPASKKQAKLRMALIGPSGSGKTYTAIKIASVFGKVAVIDTEHGSASKYADIFGFDVVELHSFDPREYINAINAAAQYGYDAVVIDSMSHSWKDLLAQKNTLDAKGGNSYVNWGKITPKQDALIEAILAAPVHVIATMRAKMDHVMDTDEKGRITVRKVGLAPIQRDDVEYEFDIVADMDISNNMIISKSRCSALSGKLIEKPDSKVAEIIKTWLTDGDPVVDAPKTDLKATSSDLTLVTSNGKPDAQPVNPDPIPETPSAKNEGVWEFNLNTLVFEVGKVSNASSQERFNTVKKMHEDENAFANVASLQDAITLVLGRLALHDIAKEA